MFTELRSVAQASMYSFLSEDGQLKRHYLKLVPGDNVLHNGRLKEELFPSGVS